MKCEYPMEELIPVVAELTEKYTSGESTSVTYEKAQQLMEAVLYCLEEYRNQADENQLPHRQNMTAGEMYETGCRLVFEKAVKTAEVYNKLIGTFRDFGNENYRDTVTMAIPGFLQYYDARFAPQNTIITMDYPTIRPITDKCGVDAVYEYLENLTLEQRFLERFPDDFVIRILSSYHSGYRKQFFNLCGIVLRSVILQLTESDSAIGTEIKVLRADRNQNRLRELLNEVLHNLICKGYEGDALLETYLQYEMKEFAFDLTMRQREQNE